MSLWFKALLTSMGGLAVIAQGTASSLAQSNDETVVYIECATGNQKRLGTGVVTSPDGHILTAKHVVFGDATQLPAGTVCEGRLGHKHGFEATLQVANYSTKYDAAILKFPPNGERKFRQFCRVSDDLLRKTVFATGFPRDTTTGSPSSRLGVLSTTQPTLEGFLETDSLTTSGMSGGMVSLANSDHFVGIVSGTELDPSTALPKFYPLLAAQVLAIEFNDYLSEASSGCRGEVRLTPKLGFKAPGIPWTADDPKLSLPFTIRDGVCSIVEIWGNFDHKDDSVRIDIDQNGAYVLDGDSKGNGTHGAFVQCVRH